MPDWNIHFDMRVDTSCPEVLKLLAKAEAMSEVIRGIPIPPYVQSRLDSLNIMRAVRGTTGIEGTEVSEDEVEEILRTPSDQPVLPLVRSRDEQEVRNASEVMRSVAEHLKEEPSAPLTEALVLLFHEAITRDIGYQHNEPGAYRTFAVQTGRYVPPREVDTVRALMKKFFEWLNSGQGAHWHPVVRAIAAHFYLISIHPFGDGNGRTSRAVESYLLYQAGVNVRGYYSLANYYYRNRSEYVSMLDHVRFASDPDLTPFVLFALRGLSEELDAVHREVLDEVTVISFRDFARETLVAAGRLGTRAGERQLRLLVGLANEPVSLKGLRSGQERLSRLYKGLSSKTLQRDIHVLVEDELIVVEDDRVGANLRLMTQFAR